MAGTNNISIGTGSGGVGSCVTTITVVANYDQQASEIYDVEMWNGNSPAQVQLINLSTGANTIDATSSPALPQAGGVIIVPPVANTNTITLKGNTGDTGISLNVASPSTWVFPSTPPTSFVLTLSSSISGMKLIWF